VISGPYWAKTFTPAGNSPVTFARQPGQRLTSAAYSVTTGPGTGGRSWTCLRRTAVTGASTSDVPHEHAAGAGTAIRSSGSSTNRNAVPASPGCLPGLRPDALREDPLRRRRPGRSEDGGFDDVEESFPSLNTSACTCAVSSPTCTSSASIRASLAASIASNSSRDTPSDSGTQKVQTRSRPERLPPAIPGVSRPAGSNDGPSARTGPEMPRPRGGTRTGWVGEHIRTQQCSCCSQACHRRRRRTDSPSCRGQRNVRSP